MNVFISWSGTKSHLAAKALHRWIKCVLQASEPFISSEDIQRGTVWFSDIQRKLQNSYIGIICLTRENKDRPWILFEAGALAKDVDRSRVCTFLIDLNSVDVIGPLVNFNHTFPTKDSLFKLVKSLNQGLEKPLDDDVLEASFEANWPRFDHELKTTVLAADSENVKVESRSNEEILSELLTMVRDMSRRLSRLEIATFFPDLLDIDHSNDKEKNSSPSSQPIHIRLDDRPRTKAILFSDIMSPNKQSDQDPL